MVNILMSRSGALVADWAIEYTQKYLKKNMKVAILGFSFFGKLSEQKYEEYYGKNSDYYLKMLEIFQVFEIKDVIWISYYNTDIEEIKEIISKADILYLPGGAPDLMMERIVEKGLLEVIKSFNKTIVGSSAGAMIQLTKYHISPDNEYHKFSEHQGLGYINDFFIEVHYRRRKKQKSSMRKINEKYRKPIYVVPDDGMIIVDNKDIISLHTAEKYYGRKGIAK